MTKDDAIRLRNIPDDTLRQAEGLLIAKAEGDELAKLALDDLLKELNIVDWNEYIYFVTLALIERIDWEEI